MPNFTLIVQGKKVLSGVLDAEAPPPTNDVWFWLYPDQFYGDVRSCAPCPAVLIFGDILAPTKTHSVILDEKIQLFQADLLALSEYGKLYKELDNVQRDNIARAWRGVYGDHTAFTNWLPNGSPRKDYVTPMWLDAGDRIYDKIRGCAGNSVKGELVRNEKGNWMLKIQTFTPDTIPTDYGVEILEHPAVMMATIQKRTGAISKFPQLVGDVPVPIISKKDVYYERYKVEQYTGARRSPYYTPGLFTQIKNFVQYQTAKVINRLWLR